MDQFSLIDKNKGMCCAQNQNKRCSKYLVVFSKRKPNCANVSCGQLFEKKILSSATGPFIALECRQCTTLFQSMDHTVSINVPHCFNQWTTLFQSMDHTVSINGPRCFNQWTTLFQSMDHTVSINGPYA
jgi:hypothetical protein